LPVTQLSCGHALCGGCAARTSGLQADVRPCLAAACEVAHGRVLCPAGGCSGFLPRAAVDAFRTDEQRDAMAGPLRLAPFARGPYVRCFACPLLLHRRGADDAAAAGLRCHCGARTCASRGGAEECCGRAHAPLSCAAARELELVIDAWRPVLQAVRGPPMEERVPEVLDQAVVPPRILDHIVILDSDDDDDEEMHAAPPDEAGDVALPGLLESDSDAGTDDEDEEMHAEPPIALAADHQMHLNDQDGDADLPGFAAVGAPPAIEVAAWRVVHGEGGVGMPIIIDGGGEEEDAVHVLPRGIWQLHNRMGDIGRIPHQRGRTAAAVAAHVAALSIPRLTAVAAAVLQGCGPAEGDAHLAAVPTDADAVLASADAACAPLRNGPALRLRRLLVNAKDAAMRAQERVRRALDEAETAAQAAGRAIVAPAAAEVAARTAAEAAADATAAAASARASAEAAAEAAARLAKPDAPDAEAAAAAAAIAAIADTSDEMVNVARGHAAAANDAHRAARDAAAGAPAAAGTDAATLSDAYLQSHTRPCPGCGVATEKGRGECNAMDPCHKCKRTWCWSCLGPVHEHSYGPCSKAGNRVAIEAAIAAARPEAAAHAAAHAEAMAAADAVANAVGRHGRRPIPRPVVIAVADVVPDAEAELATLALAAAALRLYAAVGDAAGTATQLRMVRALLAEFTRASVAAAAWQQRQQRRIDALNRVRAQREQAERGGGPGVPLARPPPAAPPDPDRDIAAPLRAAAERAATALAAAYDAAPGAPLPPGVRDFAGAAIAWARMHIARENEAAALAAATTMPAAVWRVPEAAAASRAASLALAAAEAALSRAAVARIFEALRLPTAGEEAPPQPPPDARRQAEVREMAARAQVIMRGVVNTFVIEAARQPPAAEEARRERAADGVDTFVEMAARLRDFADGLAAPW
jgi:hypothetical protein